MEPKLDLFVFIDALGWELAEEHGFLADECRSRLPLESVLGYSCACIPTILTGKRPAEHGHFAFWVYDPQSSPFGALGWLDALPSVVAGSGRFRSLLSRLVARAADYTGYFQLYNVPFGLMPRLDYVEKRDLYRPGGIVSGEHTLLDDLDAAGIPTYVSDWRRPDAANVDDLIAKLRELRPRFAFLYLGGLDAALHEHGTRSPAIGLRVRWYEERLRAVLDAADPFYGEVRLVVVSDHGMSDVTRTVDVQGALAAAGLNAGTDHVAVLDSTMARIWILDERARWKIDAALDGLGGGRTLSDAELVELGCSFDGARYGERIFLTDPGVLVFPNHMGRRPVRGMHGYHPADPSTRASFLSTHEGDGAPHGLWDLRALVRARAIEDARLVRAGGHRP